MSKLQTIIEELSEENFKNVFRPHEEASNDFKLPQNHKDPGAFCEIVNNYFEHLQKSFYYNFDKISSGIDAVVAMYRKKDPLAVYSENDDIYLSAAVEDAKQGKMPEILSGISNLFAQEGKRRYINYVFQNIYSWSDQVEIVKELTTNHRDKLPKYIDSDTPERYAQEYKWLVLTYLSNLEKEG